MNAGLQVLQTNPERLTVEAPGSSLLSPWLTLAILLFFALILYSAGRSARKVLAPLKTPAELSSYMLRLRVIGVAIGAGSLGLFWLVSYSSGSIVLDRSGNTATVSARMTAFLPAQRRMVPLNSIDAAALDFKVNARRIRLVAMHGADLSYPIWSDRPGQQEAVDAINAFLGKSRDK